ncbi:MAG TPA: CBS domain-containing protein [Vicinamibacterales bacterium]|jgi:CBS domain-containing protein
MTTGVFAVSPEASISALQDLMDEKSIRHLPVVDADGTLVGLVSQRDLLRCQSALEEDLALSTRDDLLTATCAGDIMTRQVETIEADEDLALAARILLDNKYGCLPVFEEGILAGIITEADFVRLMAAVGAADVES